MAEHVAPRHRDLALALQETWISRRHAEPLGGFSYVNDIHCFNLESHNGRLVLNNRRNNVFNKRALSKVKREEFEARVEEAAGPTLLGSDHLKAAIYDFGRRSGPFYHSDVANVLQEAERRREQADSSEERMAPRQSPRPQPGAEAHFVSRMLVESLKPWTEELRQEGGSIARSPRTRTMRVPRLTI